MWDRVRNYYRSANTQKLRRDADVLKTRTINNAKSLKTEMKRNWNTSKLYRNFPSANKVKSYTDSMKPKNFDAKYSKFRDDRNARVNNWFKSTG